MLPLFFTHLLYPLTVDEYILFHLGQSLVLSHVGHQTRPHHGSQEEKRSKPSQGEVGSGADAVPGPGGALTPKRGEGPVGESARVEGFQLGGVERESEPLPAIGGSGDSQAYTKRVGP